MINFLKKTLITSLLGVVAFSSVDITGLVSLTDKAEAATFTTEPKLDGIMQTSVFIRSDGIGFQWGWNAAYQLGTGDKYNRYNPTFINPDRVGGKRLINGMPVYSRTYLITEDYELYGVGNQISNTDFVKLDTGIKDFAGGYDNSLNQAYITAYFLGTDGKIRAIGNNYHGGYSNGLSGYGALGKCTSAFHNGNYSNTNIVYKDVTLADCGNGYKKVSSATPLDNVIQVGASSRAAVALTASNEVWVWGDGFSNSKDLAQKHPVSSLSIKKVVGTSQTNEATTQMLYAITTTGDVYRLTSGTSSVKVSITNVKDIAGGIDHVLFLTNDKKVYGSGKNDRGQLSKYLSATNVIPFDNPKLINFTEGSPTAIGAGNTHSMVMLDNIVHTFGENNTRQMGSPDDNTYSTFQKVPSLKNIVDIKMVFNGMYAVDDEGKVYTWGKSSPLSRQSFSPVLWKDFSNEGGVKQLFGNGASFDQIFGVLTNSNNVYLWSSSNDERNALGGGTNGGKFINRNSALTGKNFTPKMLSASSYNGLMLNTDGKVFSWGYDDQGALGLGKYNRYLLSDGLTQDWQGFNAYQEVKGLEGKKVVAVESSMNEASFALTDLGEVYSWGRNEYYGLGYNKGSWESADYYTPTKITGIPKIKKMAAEKGALFLVDANGEVWAIGRNNYGQQGSGDFVHSPSYMRKIEGLTNVRDVTIGEGEALFITDENEVYGLGDNRYGSLGVNDYIMKTSPYKTNMTNAKKVESGENTSMVLTYDGEVYVSGVNIDGALGTGKTTANPDPYPILFLPDIRISNQDGDIYIPNSTLKIDGTIFDSDYLESNNIYYTIYNSDAKPVTGHNKVKIKTYTSDGLTEDTFSKSITLGSGFAHGNYKVTVEADDIRSAQNIESSFSFFLDKKGPEVYFPEQGEYKTSTSLTFKLFDFSGVNRYRWAIVNKAKLDAGLTSSDWSSFISTSDVQDIQKTVTGLKLGDNYIVVEAYDRWGHKSYTVSERYFVGEKPGIKIIPFEHETWTYHIGSTVHIEPIDNGTGISKWRIHHSSDGGKTFTVHTSNQTDVQGWRTTKWVSDWDWVTSGWKTMKVEVVDNYDNTFFFDSGLYLIDRTKPTGSFSPNSGSNSSSITTAFKPSDAHSGVKQWRYRLSNNEGSSYGAWSAYNKSGFSSNITINQKGLWKIQVELTDNTNNISVIESGDYYIGDLPSITTSSTYTSNWSNSLTFDVFASFPKGKKSVLYDNLNNGSNVTSGWTLDSTRSNGAVDTYKKTFSYDTNLASGSHNLTIYAKDTTGKDVPNYNLQINIDNTNPTVAFSPLSSSWKNTNISVSISPSDAHAGIEKWRYATSKDNGTTWSTWKGDYLTQQTVILTDEGINKIKVEATDKVGNVHSTISGAFNIDKTVPSTAFTEIRISGGVEITAIQSDALSGPYRIKRPDNTYVNGNTAKFNVFENGTYTFEFSDNSGNVKTQSYTVTSIDKTPPFVWFHKLTPNFLTSGPVEIEVFAADDFRVNRITLPDGTSKIMDANNNLINKTDSATYTVTKNGLYKFVIEDDYANKYEHFVPVNNIDKTAPVISTMTLLKKLNGTYFVSVSAKDDYEIGSVKLNTGQSLVLKPNNRYELDNIITLPTNVTAADTVGNNSQENFLSLPTSPSVANNLLSFNGSNELRYQVNGMTGLCNTKPCTFTVNKISEITLSNYSGTKESLLMFQVNSIDKLPELVLSGSRNPSNKNQVTLNWNLPITSAILKCQSPEKQHSFNPTSTSHTFTGENITYDCVLNGNYQSNPIESNVVTIAAKYEETVHTTSPYINMNKKPFNKVYVESTIYGETYFLSVNRDNSKDKLVPIPSSLE